MFGLDGRQTGGGGRERAQGTFAFPEDKGGKIFSAFCRRLEWGNVSEILGQSQPVEWFN